MGQSRHLLVGIGIEFDHRFSSEGVILLPSRHEREFEPGADALAAMQTQVPLPLAERKEALRPRGPQPLEIHRQLGLVEIGRDAPGQRARGRTTG